MRYILLFWALPLGLFWGWYFLSLNDVNFGLLFLSYEFHVFSFRIYGNILGIDPETIPALVAKACVVDTLLILGIYALRRRREIIAWVKEKRASMLDPMPATVIDRAPPAE
ncbi:MAG: hypothetical protein JJ913_01665 [Rhizobiaceae bacterium]|nr:hypothetical protein [Rhizobiaceae bacterium]